MTLTLYLWRIKDKRTGRWRTLRWRMTEADAQDWASKEGVEIQQVENSAEVREPITVGWGGFVTRAQGM